MFLGWRRWFWALVALLATVAGGLVLSAYRFQERLVPNTFVGPVPVGELTPDEARRRVRVWWETEKLRPVRLVLPGGSLVAETRVSQLLRLDDEASVAQVPVQDFWDAAARWLPGQKPEKRSFEPVLAFVGDVVRLKREAEKRLPKTSPARAFLREGRIVRRPEAPGRTLDGDSLPDTILTSLRDGRDEVELPVVEAPKHVADEALEQIGEVVAEFSTRFPRSNKPRNTNIRAAAEKIDGLVLLPGDRFSFNETVGKRTIENGFKEAGVYVNGRHDTGVGGGICQVSTTLYNAALLADLKIVRRSNHSLPVPYVPIGRDAAVSYGSHDLVLENTGPTPVAFSIQVGSGVLHVRVLGRKDPGLKVRIVSEGHKSWDRGVKTVEDPTLPAGTRRVVEKGGKGHSVVTYRLVYRDGVLVRRDALGRSYYKGGPQIVAVGTGSAPSASTIAQRAPRSESAETESR
ncbi:MAG: VanW family protein [Fimbriimonadaceae bacterium]